MEWDKIVVKRDNEPEPGEVVEQYTDIDIDALVQEVWQKSCARIQERCGTMRVLNMTQPIGLNDIYTSVNILETIIGRRRLGIADLLQGCEPADFDRFGMGRITEKRVPGLTIVENYSKLIVLGKPGAGKTTFLKYLAIQCNWREFQGDRVPIFITLKEFAEAEGRPSLQKYITHLFDNSGVMAAELEQVLSHGRAMVLLDGLDEVRLEDNRRVLKQIRDFSNQFHTNQLVMTCRIAAREYTFEEFTEVEVADFDYQQIATFARKWFQEQDPVKAVKFLQKLDENPPIQELATNPLLLTLLCLVFEEAADFPSGRSQLYKEGLDLLLKKWDVSQNIEREQVYKKLSVQQKEDLLSQIALITFARGDYFFTQKDLEQYIAYYIQNLPGTDANFEALQLDSKAVLKSIEVQHGLLVERARGIYSFSHLTFQEYFAAREIVFSSDPQALETALKQLVSRVTEKRWREVFLLTVGMLRNADYLLQLMKQQVDNLVAQDEHLQAFLTWVSQKSCAVTTPYKLVAIRAFYVALAHTLVLVSGNLDLDRVLGLAGDSVEFAFTLDSTLVLKHTFALDLDRFLTLVLTRALAGTRAVDFVSAFNLDLALKHEPKLSPLSESLQQLKHQLPEPDKDRERFSEWWQANGQAWTEQLRAVMISHRNIGHDWQFSDQQKEALQQYYAGNELLVDCLNSNCYVTRVVREEILKTLFLPIEN